MPPGAARWISIDEPSPVPFPDMFVGSGLGKLGISFCRSNRGVAQEVFYYHQGDTSFQHMCSGRMPLWHNKDKPVLAAYVFPMTLRTLWTAIR